MDATPSRRQFLSATLAAGTAVVAGCTDSLGSGETERELELSLSREDGPLRESFVVDLSETRSPDDEDAFAAAVNSEAYTSQYRRPFYSTADDPEYVEHEGTYYRLGAVVVDEETVTHPVLRLSAAGDAGSEDTPDGVPMESLPDGDRRAVRIAYKAARARGNVGGAPWGLVQRGGYVYRDETAVETSDLLGADGPDHVTHRETVYAVEVTRETFHEPVYRATAEPVADSPEQLEAVLRAQFVDARFSRADISQAARDVLREAENGGYSESHPYSDGYREVLRALHRRAYLDGNIEKDAGVVDDGRRMVLYDGTYFDYWLRFTGGDEA
jgi:hypothetical protein